MKEVRIISVETTKYGSEDFGVLFIKTKIICHIILNRDKHKRLFEDFMNYLRDDIKFDFNKIELKLEE